MPSDKGKAGEVPPTHPELLVPFLAYVFVIVGLITLAIVVGLSHN